MSIDLEDLVYTRKSPHPTLVDLCVPMRFQEVPPSQSAPAVSNDGHLDDGPSDASLVVGS